MQINLAQYPEFKRLNAKMISEMDAIYESNTSDDEKAKQLAEYLQNR